MPTPKPDTRSAMLQAAHRQFAELGYGGASIASIASDVKLTKQALLHHFGSKPALYAEVMTLVAGRIAQAAEAARNADLPPQDRLRVFFIGFANFAADHPADAQLFLRVLLDQAPPLDGPHPVRPVLDELVQMVQSTPGGIGSSRAEALSLIYPVFTALLMGVVSKPALTGLFDSHVGQTVTDSLPDLVDRMVTTLIASE